MGHPMNAPAYHAAPAMPHHDGAPGTNDMAGYEHPQPPAAHPAPAYHHRPPKKELTVNGGTPSGGGGSVGEPFSSWGNVGGDISS
jgi:hypothetical protein